ncbi:MAG: RNA-binding protein [ANME-2 cluster archaeon]|nr:RNA-binding protein [ANME-2 cluster archaeon]MCL7476031.1 RNA-binding protein [ANME-2 cluster archaeon]MDF1532516.1 RNA-binding protein [ANME-2 cluster archaeon]MDW7776880.1 RNA-binding protein [Methanosarcinales archaeon]
MKIRARHQLRKSQSKDMIHKIGELFTDANVILANKKFEIAVTDEYELLLVDSEPLFFIMDGEPFFTVKGALKLKPDKKVVTVDAGAIPFVVKGADVMKPGIVSADPGIAEGDLVIVIEETHGKALAVGRALVPGDQMTEGGGKAIRTVHIVGDKLWNMTV